MIILLLILSIAATIVGSYIANKSYDWEFAGGGATIAGIVASIFLVVWGTILVGDAVESRYIDDRIAMYQEENENIESDITAIVEQYQEHETKVFDMSEVKSPATLIQLYPELKSNELVVKQIEVFNANNEKIKKLKSKQIDCKKAKFLLYFGGK